MRVTCSKCGGQHPPWECHASAAEIAAYKKLSGVSSAVEPGPSKPHVAGSNPVPRSKVSPPAGAAPQPKAKAKMTAARTNGIANGSSEARAAGKSSPPNGRVQPPLVQDSGKTRQAGKRKPAPPVVPASLLPPRRKRGPAPPDGARRGGPDGIAPGHVEISGVVTVRTGKAARVTVSSEATLPAPRAKKLAAAAFDKLARAGALQKGRPPQAGPSEGTHPRAAYFRDYKRRKADKEKTK